MLRQCRRLGLARVAVTDHDTVEGALGLARLAAGQVVVVQEVTTAEGELIGLFLHQQVPRGLSARETALHIKDQGGLVYLQHPYDTFRRHLREEAIEGIAQLVDIVEVFNGRSDREANRKAEDLCEILGAASGAGSDAHTVDEIGCVFIEMQDFSGPREFLARLHDARIVRRPSRARLWAEARLRGQRISRSATSG